MEKEKQIYCSDCSICAGIAKQNAHGKWTLWGVSEVLGMGNALFEKRPFTDEFDNVEPFNTMDGTSYIAVCKGGLWGLIQVKFKNKTRISEDSWEWKWVEDLKCKSLEEVQSLINNMVYGYSERGVFNSIIYYLNVRQEMIGEFLTYIGVKGFNNKDYDFVFLNEQSFSDFGDNDLTIIITKKCSQEKTVLFIEGKVKTSSGNFFLQKHFAKINNNNLYKGVSSNIFAQLYYKFLLTNVQGSSGFEIKDCVIGKPTKKLGNNRIVKSAFENYIKDAQEYYYVAILPVKVGNETFRNYFNDLNLDMPLDRIISIYWGTIQDFFIKNVAIQVIKNFDYNEGQIY
ncbi:hypothetical protein EZS27_027031 [termite gut metagenome]|uniref:Uncharacterized protein n=1 Tax=termite gut metagenome TaxID=433724 RepID=A0A5J4QR08_9ZZZZ